MKVPYPRDMEHKTSFELRYLAYTKGDRTRAKQAMHNTWERAKTEDSQVSVKLLNGWEYLLF